MNEEQGAVFLLFYLLPSLIAGILFLIWSGRSRNCRVCGEKVKAGEEYSWAYGWQVEFDNTLHRNCFWRERSIGDE